ENPSAIVGIFGSVQSCSFTALKVYRGHGDISTGVHDAEKTLTSLGFQPSRQVEVGKSGNAPYYNSAKPSLSATLTYVTKPDNAGSDASQTYGPTSIPFQDG